MFDRNLFKLPGMRGILGALVVLALLQAGFIVGQACGLAQAVCILFEGRTVADAAPSIALFAVSFGMLQLLKFAQETMLDRYSLTRACDLRDQLLKRTFDPRTLIARREGAAHVANVAADRMDELQTYLRIIPPKLVGMMAITVPLLVAEFVTDWPSGVILAVMFPVIIFFMILLGRQARDQAARQYAAYTRLTNRFMDTLRGLPVIRAFRASDAEGAVVFRQSEKLRAATVRTLRTATLSSAVLDLCATFGVAAVAMMLAFRLLDGSIPLYTGLVALILAPEYFTPIRSFASDYHASQDGKNALVEVLALLEGSEAAADDAEAASVPIWSDDSELIFSNVSFAHDDTGAGVRDVSFAVRGFERVAVVGRSGAGKSTLADLVAGFIAPTSGMVTVNGQAADLTQDSWKRQVRYIPQKPYILRATLADNIRFYNPDAPREAVEAAVRNVGLTALVETLPDGLDTLVGEGARGLSGGEAHRVALARVMLDDGARVLVFDEPTAHLDVQTELDLKEPMLKLMQGKLVFFATHRLHWTDDLDRVITLSDGRLTSEEVRDER